MSLHAVGTVLEAPPAKHLNILFGGETNEEDFRGDDCSGVCVLDRGLRGRGGQGSGSGGGEGRPGGEEGIPGGRQCSPGGREEGREEGEEGEEGCEEGREKGRCSEEGSPGGRQCSPGSEAGGEEVTRFFRVAVRPHKGFPGPAGRGGKNPPPFFFFPACSPAWGGES